MQPGGCDDVRSAFALAFLVAFLAALPAPMAVAEPFTAPLPFVDVATDGHLPLLSGALDVRSPAGSAPTVMHRTADAFEVSGLQVVCWRYPCHQAEGPLVVRVATGSSVALRFPAKALLHLEAGHAFATPVHLDGDRSGFGGMSAGMSFVPSLAAATTGGTLTVEPEVLPPTAGGPVPAQPPPGSPQQAGFLFQAPDPDDEDGAVLATLTESSELTVLDGGRVVHQVRGAGGLLLQGRIWTDPVRAESFLLPCALRCQVTVTDDGTSSDVGAATASLLGLVELAQGAPAPPVDLGPWASLLNPVAAGVLLDLPLVADPADFTVANLTVIRFDRFETTLYSGSPSASGDGPLVIQSGDVQGSPAFVGGPYFGMPLWSYFLWGAALLMLLVRVATRAPKEHGRWDRLRIVGRVAGALAWALLAIVWHLNFDAVIGISATSDGLGAMARLLVALAELGTLLLMVAMVVLPSRILLANAFRTMRQGRFMGLAGPLASGVGILLGIPLLLGFVDLALAMFR